MKHTRRNSGPRTIRSISPLTDDDFATVKEFVGGARHNTARLDHVGHWRTCDACRIVVEYTMFSLAARARSKGLTREEALAFVTGPRVRITSVLIDGMRAAAVDRGAPARPEIAAKAKAFIDTLTVAFARGALSADVETATELLAHAIRFCGDPGERVRAGWELPFDRFARAIFGDDDDTSIAVTMRLWADIVDACSTNVRAADAFDSVITSTQALTQHTTLWRVGDDGTETSLDDTAVLTAPWDCSTAPNVESPIVTTAVAAVASDPRFARARSDKRREEIAADAVLRAVAQIAGEVPSDIASHPALAELANEVIAEVAAAA